MAKRSVWTREPGWFLALGCLLVIGCASEPPADLQDAEVEELPDQEISNFVLRQTQNGALEWVFQAAVAHVFDDTGLIQTDELTADFYNEAGEVGSVLTADHGTIDQRSNDMEARGHVRLKTGDGRLLETETLFYDSKRRKIHTDDFVKVIDGRNVLTGYGLESDPNLQDGQFQIQRNVKATIQDLPAAAQGRE